MQLHRKPRARAQTQARVQLNCLRDQLFTAFRATSGKDSAAAFGGHASAEAVSTGAVKLAGLKSAFHGKSCLIGFVVRKNCENWSQLKQA
jgi:hypothetical protein